MQNFEGGGVTRFQIDYLKNGGESTFV